MDAAVRAARARDQIAGRHELRIHSVRLASSHGLFPGSAEPLHPSRVAAALESAQELRKDELARPLADRVRQADERLARSGRTPASQDDASAGAETPDFAGEVTAARHVDGVNARDADHGRPRAPKRGAQGPALRAEIEDRNLVPRTPRRRGDVLEAERLRPEERTQAETLRRDGSDEEDFHGSGPADSYHARGPEQPEGND